MILYVEPCWASRGTSLLTNCNHPKETFEQVCTNAENPKFEQISTSTLLWDGKSRMSRVWCFRTYSTEDFQLIGNLQILWRSGWSGAVHNVSSAIPCFWHINTVRIILLLAFYWMVRCQKQNTNIHFVAITGNQSWPKFSQKPSKQSDLVNLRNRMNFKT